MDSKGSLPNDKNQSNQTGDSVRDDLAVPRERAELLRQSQAHLQNIISRSADGIIVIDREGIIQFVNPAAELLFGWPAEGLLGALFGFPMVAGETTELDIFRRNGGPGVAEMRVVEITWEGNIAYLASLRDITRRKLKEREIEQRNVSLEHRVEERTFQVNRLNEQINAIFETASEGIVLVGSDGYIDMVNPSVTRKFGYLPSELKQRPLSVLADISQRDMVDKWLHDVAVTGQSQRHQVMGLAKNGSTFYVEISLARVHNNDNHVVCILHDISHFKEVERIKDNFVSMVSHELRSPITSLSLIADSLDHFYHRYTGKQIKQKLEELNKQSHVLLELIEGILDISRLEARAGKPVKSEPVDMVGVLAKVFTELRADANDKNQTLMIYAARQPLILSGDQIDFTRIWRNLISNAIKYTPEGGVIKARLDCVMVEEVASTNLSHHETLMAQLEDGRHYIIGQVEDNGYGIGPADLANLFQRFNRGWARTSQIPGTGLGLALVRELLLLYKGDITAFSQLGEGSTFTFWIPID